MGLDRIPSRLVPLSAIILAGCLPSYPVEVRTEISGCVTNSEFTDKNTVHVGNSISTKEESYILEITSQPDSRIIHFSTYGDAAQQRRATLEMGDIVTVVFIEKAVAVSEAGIAKVKSDAEKRAQLLKDFTDQSSATAKNKATITLDKKAGCKES